MMVDDDTVKIHICYLCLFIILP